MHDKTKRTIILVSIYIVSIISCFIGGNIFRASINRNRIDELSGVIEDERERNTELTKSNTELRAENKQLIDDLTESKRELDLAKGIIRTIGQGLAEDAGTVQSIIIRIRKVRKAIEEYQERTNNSIDSGNP